MIKKFMSTMFPKIIDICFALSMLMVILGAFGAAFKMYGFFSGLFAFLGVLIFGTVAMILSFGFIYILLDIRDSLFDIRDSVKK